MLGRRRETEMEAETRIWDDKYQVLKSHRMLRTQNVSGKRRAGGFNHGGGSAAQSWDRPGGAHYDWLPGGPSGTGMGGYFGYWGQLGVAGGCSWGEGGERPLDQVGQVGQVGQPGRWTIGEGTCADLVALGLTGRKAVLAVLAAV